MMIGKKLGQYEVLEEIGQGGMGTVYRGRQTSLNRDVALKVMLSRQAVDHDALERFRREGAVVAQLAHPNIVQVFDVGEQDGLHYIAMEFVEGRTVAQMLKGQGPFGYKDAVCICAQVASALAVAHEKKLVHRDVKPSNILVGKNLFAKLGDFGIVALSVGQSEERLTADKAAVGTPHYMSPEQIRGRADLAGASDVFSLGVVLYEMLAGKHPFAESTPYEAVSRMLNERLPPIRRYRENIPDDLEAVLNRCVEPDKDKRFADGGALQEALEKVRLHLEMAEMQGDSKSQDYQARATTTGLFYVDSAERSRVGMLARVKLVLREALALVRDPHRKERRGLAKLYADCVEAREKYKTGERQLEELRKRQEYHEDKAKKRQAENEAQIAAGNAGEAESAAEQEADHDKLALDYGHQVEELAKQVEEWRAAYDTLRADQGRAADALALLDAESRRTGKLVPSSQSDPRLAAAARVVLAGALLLLAGLVTVGVMRVGVHVPTPPQPVVPASVVPRLADITADEAGWKYLADAEPESSEVGWGSFSRHTRNHPQLKIGGVVFATSLDTHASSLVSYNLDGDYDEFRTYYGMKDGAGGAAHFHVAADGKEIFRSGEMWGYGPSKQQGVKQEVCLDVRDVKVLQLRTAGVRGGASAWSAWGSPRVHLASKTLPEDWMNQWEIVQNDVERNLNLPGHHQLGWKPGELDPAKFGNRPYWEGSGKRAGLVALHPLSLTEPAKIRFKGRVDARTPILLVEACGNTGAGGDFSLLCIVDGETIGSFVVDGVKWHTCEFDLSKYLGGKENPVVELWDAAGGNSPWSFEHCFFDSIRFRKAASSIVPGTPGVAAPWQIGFEDGSASEFDSTLRDDPRLVSFDVGSPASEFPGGLGTDIGNQRSVISINFSGMIPDHSSLVIGWSAGGSEAVEQFRVDLDGVMLGNSSERKGVMPEVCKPDLFFLSKMATTSHQLTLTRLKGDGLIIDYVAFRPDPDTAEKVSYPLADDAKRSELIKQASEAQSRGEFEKARDLYREANDAKYQFWWKYKIEEIRCALRAANPAYTGELEDLGLWKLRFDRSRSLRDIASLKNMPFALLSFRETGIASVEPLKGMPLVDLDLNDTAVSDVTPLAGMPLASLSLDRTQVTNIGPLRGMPLARLTMREIRVADLSPLKNMTLNYMDIADTDVCDLGPLAGQPLRALYLERTQVSSLAPLEKAALVDLAFSPGKVSDGVDIVRRMESLITVNWMQKAAFLESIR